MNDHKEPCVHCEGTVFKREEIGGRVMLVCQNKYCNTAVEGYVEYDETHVPFGYYRETTRIQSSSTPVERKHNENAAPVKPADDIYQGYCHILSKQKDALVNCIQYFVGRSVICGSGDSDHYARVEVAIRYLWSQYMQNLKEINQGSSLNAEDEDEVENGLATSLPSTSSAPPKLPFVPDYTPKTKQKRQSGKSNEWLLTANVDELTPKEKKKRRQLQQDDFNAAILVQSGIDLETTRYKNLAKSSTEKKDEQTQVSSSRSRLVDLTSAESVSHRSIKDDPKYLTLFKLTSFLHGALLMAGVPIFDYDIIRWINEGHIPYYGASRLVPETVNLKKADLNILDGNSENTVPTTVESLRFHTSAILRLLDTSHVMVPPVEVVASKIILDLQLPLEFIDLLMTLDRLYCSAKNKGDAPEKWTKSELTGPTDSRTGYTAALLVYALKSTHGLDDLTEKKISEVATKANIALKRPPSSRFSGRDDTHSNPSTQAGTGSKTLFVFAEWVEFINYRQSVLERLHVPTAQLSNSIEKVDPNVLLDYAKKMEGRFNRRGSLSSESDKEFLELVEKLSLESSSEPRTEPFQFRPCKYPSHGLAMQLMDSDPVRYQLLKQTFADKSSIDFTQRPKVLALELRHRADPPFVLQVCEGLAVNEMNLLASPLLLADGHPNAKPAKPTPQSGYRTVQLKFPIKNALKPHDSDKDLEKLILYTPTWYPRHDISSFSSMHTLSQPDWELIQLNLPEVFKWTLDVVSRSVGEEPKDLYFELLKVENILGKLSDEEIDFDS